MDFTLPDKKQIRQSFNAKARYYDTNAGVQLRILKQLVSFLPRDIGSDEIWLDIGCGTGLFESLLGERPLTPVFYGLDCSYQSLRISKKKKRPFFSRIQGDIESLPVKNNAISGIVCASTLQWISDSAEALQRIYSILKPGGTFVFAVFLEKTLQTLTTVQKKFGIDSPVHYYNETWFKSLLAETGFIIKKTKKVQEIDVFDTPGDLLTNLSRIGASAVPGKRLTRKKLLAFKENLASTTHKDGKIHATYNVLIGRAVRK